MKKINFREIRRFCVSWKGILVFGLGIITLTVYLDWLILVLSQLPKAQVSGFASVNDRILFATLVALVWYAWLTRGIYNEATTERELSQKPILIPYIRTKDEIGSKWNKLSGNLIMNNCYVLRVRNGGKGPAFNLGVGFIGNTHKNRQVNDELEVYEYQNKFLAPEKDEQAVGFRWRVRKQAINISDLKGVQIKLKCKNVNGREYEYNYEITNPEKLLFTYLENEK